LGFVLLWAEPYAESKDVNPTPHAISGVSVFTASEFSHFPTGQVRAGGWLRQMVESETNGVTGHLDELDSQVGGHIFFAHNVEKEDQFGWWNGEYESNWIDGYARLASSTDDPTLLNKARQWFEKLMEVQRNDKEPYIGIYSAESRKFPRWSDVCGELWPQGRVFLAMLGYFERTQDKRILDSLKQAADLSMAHFFQDLPIYKTKVNSHTLMIVEPMLNLCTITGDRRYLDYSIFLYDKLRWFNDRTLRGDLFLHGVHVVQNIRIPLLLYEFTGERRYLEEGLRGMEICRSRYMNVAGTIRSDEMVGFAVPDRGSEYCTTVEWFISAMETARITGDMSFADVAERCYFNAAQGARFPNGTAIQYRSFPNQLYVIEQGTDEWKNQPLFGPTHQPLCCNAMAGRLLPAYLNAMWMKTKNEGLLAFLYGPCSFKTSLPGDNRLSIRETTDYPFSDLIRFEIDLDRAATVPLSFRIPGWCERITIRVNGQEVVPTKDRGVAAISRKWKKGDILELILPMKTTVEYSREWVSVVRGPLAFALPVPYQEVKVRQIAPGFSFFRFLPEKDFVWNQFLMFNHFPEEARFKVEPMALKPGESPWEHPPITVRTKAQVSNDSWRLGMQWYTRESLQPPAPPSAILAYQIDQKLTKEITLLPYGATRLRIVYFPYAVNVIE
jgi:uncharacterized protein